MPDTFSPARLIELEQKLRGLDAEFTSWRDRSEPGGDFAKHTLQVRRAPEPSRVAGGKRQRATGGGKENGHHRVRRPEVEQQILAVHRIWEFFRAKLAQRLETGFAAFLSCADELAWACYEPARALAYPDPVSNERREPPLVFFNGGWSPFAVARDRAIATARRNGAKRAIVRNAGSTPSCDLSPSRSSVCRGTRGNTCRTPWSSGTRSASLVEEDFGLTVVVSGSANAAAEVGAGMPGSLGRERFSRTSMAAWPAARGLWQH